MHSLGKPKVAVLSHENNNIYVHFCINNATTTETVYVLSVFFGADNKNDGDHQKHFA